MHSKLLDMLVDPISKLQLQADIQNIDEDGNILEGSLSTSDQSKTYKIANGIPRFVLTDDIGQKQTENSFGYKWEQTSTYESLGVKNYVRQWLVDRYGFGHIEDMRHFFSDRKRILDAGCGGGHSALLWLDTNWQKDGNAEWVGADISSAIDVAQTRLAHIPETHFVQADVLQLPFADGCFDTIFSEGVLHHTPSTEKALKSLVPLLEVGGELMFYIYRKKGPIREFTDDYIRDQLSTLPPEEAWEALRPLTKLGQALAELNVEIDVPEDIPLLGIEAGRQNIQRLIYWQVAKLFWNDAYDFEANHHVNFDWYHPRYAFRQTEEEVRLWCEESGLAINHFDIQPSGFTVRAIKQA